MSVWRRLLLALCLLAGPPAAQAATALFYQPQLRDMAVPETQWSDVFAQVRGYGFDTLVLQWTQYGDDFGDASGRAWLQRRVAEARAQGLRIVFGLHADPEFFRRQEQPPSVLSHYLQRQRRRDAQLARRWAAALGAVPVDGWYLPLEIDDRRWRDARARAELLRHLARTRDELQAVARVPVIVTSFFVGNMTPEGYRELLRETAATGVRVWVQDGAGTGRLRATERDLYLDAAAAGCRDAVVDGVVYELFRQTGNDDAFSAEAPTADAADRLLAQRAPCGGDSVYFSLRYLPAMADVLAR